METSPNSSYDSLSGVIDDRFIARLPSPPSSPLPLTLDASEEEEEEDGLGGGQHRRGTSSVRLRRLITTSSTSGDFSYEHTEHTTAVTDAETTLEGSVATEGGERLSSRSTCSSSHASSSSSSKKPKETAPLPPSILTMVGPTSHLRSPVRRVRIADAASGLGFVDAVYRWPAEHHPHPGYHIGIAAGANNSISSNSVGSMIQAFYQFAREISSGEVVSVSFDAPHIDQFNASHSIEGTTETGVPPGPMTMLCLAEAGVVFTLFLEPAYAHKEEESTSGSIAAAAVGGDGDAAVMMRAWLVAVKDAFVVKFPRQQLDGIRERLTALQTGFTEPYWDELNASAEAEVRAPLEAFRPVLDEMERRTR